MVDSTTAHFTSFGSQGKPTHRFTVIENRVDGLCVNIDGDTRRFRLRHRHRPELDPVVVPLGRGALLVMKGDTQENWKHQIPKTRKVKGPRVNLTFRTIIC